MSYNTNFVSEIVPLIEGLESTEKVELSNIIFKAYNEASEITNHHPVITGVRHGNLVPIVNAEPTYAMLKDANGNGCVTNDCTIDDNYSFKKWEIGEASCRVAICVKSLEESMKVFFGLSHLDYKELDTLFVRYLTEKIEREVAGARWRLAYFGDVDSTFDYMSPIDGFYKRIQAIATANPEQRVQIDANAGADYTAQKFTNPQDAFNILNDMYGKYMESNFTGKDNVEIKTTKSIALGYLMYLQQNKQIDCCFDPDGSNRQRFDVNSLNIFGIPINVLQEKDSIINKVPALNGGGGTNARVLPHRAILTYRENLPIGTSENDALSEFDLFYDKKDKKIYVDVAVSMGTQIIDDESLIVAY